jgi:uncharacterized membrane protein YraQ (UPF0718 family)
MKKLGSLVVLSLAAIVAVLFIGANSVKASSPFTINVTNTANETNVTNTAANNVAPINTNIVANNTIATNNINENLTKNEISKTGEFDTYIISGVAIAALLVGTVAFVKSRKLN